MKISYNGMWVGFDPNNNWFSLAMKDYFQDDNIIFSLDVRDSDIIISSVFNPINISSEKSKKIFYTGESRMTGYTFDQALLGFAKTNINSKIYRLPIWNLYINWWRDNNLLAHDVDVPKMGMPLSEQEVDEIYSRSKFACMVSSNPVQKRIEVFSRISEQIHKVDGFGAQFGSHDSRNKLEILRDYKFNICFENTVAPGYVTEKLFEAKLAGCIPIYWGDEEAKKDFNPRCFINYNDFESEDLFIKHIGNIYKSEQAMKEIIAEPMFETLPDIGQLYHFFDIIGLKG
jgi:hypothetical protein